MLAEKLNMTPDEAERWIVNLIRNARLDAKIDSKLVRNFKINQQFLSSVGITIVYTLLSVFRVMWSWGRKLPLFTSKL